jgi:hypothetical protein
MITIIQPNIQRVALMQNLFNTLIDSPNESQKRFPFVSFQPE